jgi:hypothetical protein
VKNEFKGMIEQYEKTKEIKCMLAIPIEFKKELNKAIEILKSSSFKEFVEKNLSIYILQSIGPVKEFQNNQNKLLITEISYETFV